MARPRPLVTRPHDLRLQKNPTTEATARPHHLNGAPVQWPRRVRAVSLKTFGQSNTSVWHVRAPLLARAHGLASARWPWRVRALALGALGPITARSARSRPSDRASA
ncbi:hypothetical protein PIB30_060208 [Stylosanthes scabra]|uniref:Uncharacterized protein n=1 Tax=Stylosanthes scabra TaxID=79078 RepID=A0ABU6YHY3_9FABA|nr:hypothetical protein [Stylosanthes scabra]